MDRKYQVFVSSTYTDLIEERKTVSQAILECDCFPAGMELFPASSRKQWDVIKKIIDESDYYLLLIAGRYGSLGTDSGGKKLGYTEMEFDYAMSSGKPIIAMLHRHPENLVKKFSESTTEGEERLGLFREKAQDGRLVCYWEDKKDLRAEVIKSLNAMKKDGEGIGWIRADSSLSILESEEIISRLEAQIKRVAGEKSSLDRKLSRLSEENDRLLEEKSVSEAVNAEEVSLLEARIQQLANEKADLSGILSGLSKEKENLLKEKALSETSYAEEVKCLEAKIQQLENEKADFGGTLSGLSEEKENLLKEKALSETSHVEEVKRLETKIQQLAGEKADLETTLEMASEPSKKEGKIESCNDSASDAEFSRIEEGFYRIKNSDHSSYLKDSPPFTCFENSLNGSVLYISKYLGGFGNCYTLQNKDRTFYIAGDANALSNRETATLWYFKKIDGYYIIKNSFNENLSFNPFSFSNTVEFHSHSGVFYSQLWELIFLGKDIPKDEPAS